jgi:ribosomal protein S18 acetylase RimI-like enzyme
MDIKYVIRKAVPSDAESLIQFNIAMALETEQKKLKKDQIEAGVKGLFDKPQYGFYMVAEAEGSVIASLMITYEWSDWRNGLFWWIQSVYVLPEFRRKAVYRSMYQEILKLAEKEPEICGCRLYVERENSVAQKTYTSLGMSETQYKLYEEEFERM